MSQRRPVVTHDSLKGRCRRPLAQVLRNSLFGHPPFQPTFKKVLHLHQAKQDFSSIVSTDYFSTTGS